jgi:hypothetical protein
LGEGVFARNKSATTDGRTRQIHMGKRQREVLRVLLTKEHIALCAGRAGRK